MAESWRARANRYVRGDFTKAELMGALGIMLVDQAIDVATFGRLSQLKGKAFVRVALPLITRAVPLAGRAALSVGGTGLGVGRLVMRNPYILGAAAIYVGYQERERIKQLLDQGYEIVEDSLPSPPSPSIPGVEEIITSGMLPGVSVIPPAFGRPKRPRKSSTFNKAVKAGMLAVKKSTSYGGKGVIKPAKKAFSVVVKLAAAKKKKKKAPKSGIRRLIWNAMKGLR